MGVYDGDTVKVLKGTKTEKVRLYGIDCPEISQPFYQKARSFTSDKAFGKQVEVVPVQEDKYGRVVGWVYIGDECLNKELVKNGLAWHYVYFAPHETELRLLEKEAREKRINIWSQKKPQPPWEFRKQ
ncbi:MAG: thermonuclease family protein [Syntrophaceae bacterium]|nr:thermonuclease family protein [Syntrophaceae bacterium]